jgi:dTDP-glucose 4,6-dehydratase
MEGKRIVVTGADGFIGSHLVQALVKKGAKVRALAMYNSFNHWGWLEELPERDEIEVITGDIRDPNICKKAVEGREIVFHLAALIAIPYSYLAPHSYIETNVLGTTNLCQASLDQGVGRFIHMSSSEVYGTARYIPIDEKHPLQPQSPYSASKIGADCIASSYFSSFALPLTIARPFNNYGPRQSLRAVIPTIISQIGARFEEIALGDVSPTRDFVFVEDTCESLIRLATCERAIGETVNIGSGVEISIQDIAKKIAELMGVEVRLLEDPMRMRPKGSEVLRLCCNSEKLKKLISYVPATSLEAGLKRTIDWFLEQPHRNKGHLYHV